MHAETGESPAFKRGSMSTAHFSQVEIIASPKTLVTSMETFRPDVVLLDMNFYCKGIQGTIEY